MSKKIKKVVGIMTAIALTISPYASAQISGDTVKIGFITDLTGLYADIDGGGGRRCGWRSAWWALGECLTVGWWRVVAGAGGPAGQRAAFRRHPAVGSGRVGLSADLRDTGARRQ